MSGIFNLENLDSLGDEDILEANIYESSEFANGSYATNDVSNHVSGSTVSIPGGDKEDAPNKNYPEKEIPIPGGDKEQPTAKPYDQSSVSIPATTTLTEDEYNRALKALQQSFKEGTELLQRLSEATVVHKTVEDLQAEYVESALEDALLAAYENGPIFEAVDRSDKNEVKAIVTKIRKNIKTVLNNKGIDFYNAKAANRLLVGFLGGLGGVAAGAAASMINPVIGGAVANVAAQSGNLHIASGFQQLWTTRLWQVVGVINIEEGNIKDIADKLTEEYKEDLGEYKILYSKASPTIVDLFRNKFGWKNTRGTYFLLVDKKLPKELKEMEKAIDAAAKAKDDDSEDKKEDKKEEKKED